LLPNAPAAEHSVPGFRWSAGLFVSRAPSHMRRTSSMCPPGIAPEPDGGRQRVQLRPDRRSRECRAVGAGRPAVRFRQAASGGRCLQRKTPRKKAWYHAHLLRHLVHQHAANHAGLGACTRAAAWA
jgi:hypothetical protein